MNKINIALISTLALLATSCIQEISLPIVENETQPVFEEPVKKVPVSSPSVAKPKQSCHASYSGCLKPNASDYDCAGGSGNGPYYTGLVQVVGPDVFGLDRDGDGWGCE